jgi:GNAT superfamily N-acetyltransferase
LANQATGASRTFVVAQAERVAAYYCLAAAAVAPNDVTGRIRRNMPDPIPAVLLGRLAVDRRDQGRGLARGMVKDAVARTLQVSATLGVRCLVVNAISAEAARFWAGLGFTPSPGDPLLLSVTLQDAAAALGPA